MALLLSPVCTTVWSLAPLVLCKPLGFYSLKSPRLSKWWHTYMLPQSPSTCSVFLIQGSTLGNKTRPPFCGSITLH